MVRLLPSLLLSFVAVIFLAFVYSIIAEPSTFPLFWNDLVDLVFLVFRVFGGTALIVIFVILNFCLNLASIFTEFILGVSFEEIKTNKIVEMYDTVLKRFQNDFYMDV